MRCVKVISPWARLPDFPARSSGFRLRAKIVVVLRTEKSVSVVNDPSTFKSGNLQAVREYGTVAFASALRQVDWLGRHLVISSSVATACDTQISTYKRALGAALPPRNRSRWNDLIKVQVQGRHSWSPWPQPEGFAWLLSHIRSPRDRSDLAHT